MALLTPLVPTTGRSPAGSAPDVSSTAMLPAVASTTWVRAENARPGTTDWRIPDGRQATDFQLAGWADKASVTKGESVGLHVHSRLGRFTVTAYRLGWYGSAGARKVWTSAPVNGYARPGPTLASGRMVTTSWPTSTRITTTGWPEGTYLLKLTAGGRQRYVPLTVRSSSTTGRLVLVNAVTTYQAYNSWGGYSLYRGPNGSFATRALRVSFNRPYDGNGATQLLNFERAAIGRAERQGLGLAYLTSWDLDRDGSLLRGARGMVSLGHDEYWSPRMRTAVEAARDRGTNLAFLGANSVYWRVRFQDSGRTMAGYKSAALDPVKGSRSTTVQWRQRPAPLPEHSLVGMLYECFPARGALVVHTPGFFLYQGTGVSAGTRFAGLIGTEIDRAYPIAGTPRSLQVVAHSPATCGSSGHTYSDMTYYTASSGAGVFSTGTMLWVRGLRGTDSKYGITTAGSTFTRTVTANLFAAMAAGPMGRAHPSVPNLAGIHASSSTSTGTGGAYSLP